MQRTLTHIASPDFWVHYHQLPEQIQCLADKNYELLKQNPRHPSLQLKRIEELWSVRVGQHYRALGIDMEDAIQWFWIGSHAEYDRLVR